MLLDGYVRVSQVAGRGGESFISPAVQRQQIEQWASAHGATLGEVFVELDESGGRRDRPMLLEALARVEAGETSGIIVAKLDRFGRSLVDGLAGIERITQAGGTLVSVGDGLDFSTDTGKLVLRIMLSMAEWELDRTRSNWSVARGRAIARGIAVGRGPAGYSRRRDGRLSPDPRTAPTISELFRRRAAGSSIAELRHWLDGQGIPSPRGGTHWTGSTIASILRNPTYLGQVRHGEFSREGAHKALVDPVTWQAAQAPVAKHKRRFDRAPSLLRGLLRCGGCQRPMSAITKRRPGRPDHVFYACQSGTSSAGSCPVRAGIRDSVVEPHMEALLWQELSGPRAVGEDRLADLEAAGERAEDALARYRDNDRLLDTLGAARFETGIRVRVKRVEQALLAVHWARRAREGPDLPPPAELRKAWPGMSIAERAHAFAEVFEVVFVMKGSKNPESRLFAFRRGDTPAGLQDPGRPQRLAGMVPFRPREHPGHVRLRRGSDRAMSRARLERELATFLGARDKWPPYREFQAEGRGLLFAQVQRQGGNRYWSRAFERDWTPEPTHRVTWSDARIEQALGPFLRERTVWPAQDEFRAAGLQTARNAAIEAGGAQRWAAHYSLELPWRRRSKRHRWDDAEVEAALTLVVADSKDWPPKRLFYEAGQHNLYQALLSREKRERWAKRLGLNLPDSQRVGGRYRWHDKAIRKQLEPFLEDQEWFPTKRQFDAAGATPLYVAIGQSDRGLDGWAKAVGLPRRPGGRMPKDGPTRTVRAGRAEAG